MSDGDLSLKSVVFSPHKSSLEESPSLEFLDLAKTTASLFVWDQKVSQAHPKAFEYAQQNWPSPSQHIIIEHPEDFKSFERAPTAWKPLLDVLSQTEIQQILVIGGGALSDSVGTLASLWHRGSRWSIVPTTWLSAIDAAHGGKTALNYNGKNQLGSFHLPHRVYIDSAWMQSLEPIEAWHAMGELHKTALLDYAGFQNYWDELKSDHFETIKLSAHEKLAKYLKQAIAFKYSIVEKDPEEHTGLRRVLNLGHTLGHILESSQHWPHGYAVLLGLDFALHASEHHFHPEKSSMNENSDGFFHVTRKLTNKLIATHPWGRRTIDLNESDFLSLLKKDKKHAAAVNSKEWILMHPSRKAERVTLNHSTSWRLFNDWLRQSEESPKA